MTPKAQFTIGSRTMRILSCMSRYDPPTTLIPVGQQPYHALLLRYWREEAAAAWRYVVQDLETGEQYSFADLDLLIAFLFQHVENRAQ